MDISILTIIITSGIFLFAQLSFFVLIVKMIVKPIEKSLNNHISETNKKIDSLSQRFDHLTERIDQLYKYLMEKKDR